MPLLALHCNACGHTFEELVPLSNTDKIMCEDCGEEVSRHYQGKSLFGMLGKETACGPMGDCPHAGTGCGFACRH